MFEIDFITEQFQKLTLLNDKISMPAQVVKVEGYEEFKRVIKLHEKSEVFVYFVGNKNEKGVSWCPDCNSAHPTINKAVELYAPENSVFIEVQIGTQEEYKDSQNKFRLDPELRLTQVPTLLHWKSSKRLEGSYYCGKLDVLELFFQYEEP